MMLQARDSPIKRKNRFVLCNKNRKLACQVGSKSPSLQERCLGWGFFTGLRLLAKSWRLDVGGQHTLDDLTNKRHVLAFWHRHNVALFRLFQDHPIIALTNQSHRGQVIANMCERTGVRPIQLQQSGKKRMLRSLASVVDDGLGIGIAVDGPLGPADEVKPVVMHLASQLDLTIVPLSVAVSQKHAMTSRWDKLEIPYPFARIAIEVGEPFKLSRTESRNELRNVSIDLKTRIDLGTKVAQQKLAQNELPQSSQS